MQLLSLVGTLGAAYAVWCLISLFTEYRAARKSGLPIVLVPVNVHNLAWMIFSVPLRPLFQSLLPKWLAFRMEMSTYGFEFNIGYQILNKYGGTYLHVGPGTTELWVSDPEMATTIASRPKEFPISEITNQIMGRFGPNIISSNGEDWQRQRRIIAPVINERVSSLVWQESINQATGMIDSFTKNDANDHANGIANGHVKGVIDGKRSGVTDVSISGVRQIAINVLSAAGYGKPRPWSAKEEASVVGQGMSFMDALFSIITQLVASSFIPPAILLLPILPQSIRKIGQACQEFPIRAADMITEERSAANTTGHNLMSVMVRVSDQEKKSGSGSKLYLTEEELTGNLFQFTLAGFDTTSNTMAYAITCMAIYPEWQKWVLEEIDDVAKTGDLDYESTFPRLKRCLALMYEVLRLYTPVAHLARSNLGPTTLKMSDGTSHEIPGPISIYISGQMIHLRSDLYPDPLAFRPSRWLSEDEQTFLEPAKGTFLPWSQGPRYCPGMKMSQVEFVSVFMTIFKSCRIEPALQGGETMDQAQERYKGIMRDSQPLITLQMKKPRDVKLRWTRR